MPTDTSIILICFLAFIIFLIVYAFISRGTNTTKYILNVWASQGPFDSAEQSAQAMRYAYLAIMGPEETEKNEHAILKHAEAFKKDPDEWNRICQGVEQVSKKAAEYITIAKGLIAMDTLNKDLVQTGHKLFWERQSDGTMNMSYRQILSDEEIKKKDKELNEEVLKSIGENILKNLDKSQDAVNLHEFLCEAYTVTSEDEEFKEFIENRAYCLGKIWFACNRMIDQNPDSELSKDFKKLNDAYLAVHANANE